MTKTQDREIVVSENARELRCPFVYSTGLRCAGCVKGWEVNGHRKSEALFAAKKVRIWCTEQYDHAGYNKSVQAKERMEFYPEKLLDELYNSIEASLR